MVRTHGLGVSTGTPHVQSCPNDCLKCRYQKWQRVNDEVDAVNVLDSLECQQILHNSWLSSFKSVHLPNVAILQELPPFCPA